MGKLLVDLRMKKNYFSRRLENINFKNALFLEKCLKKEAFFFCFCFCYQNRKQKQNDNLEFSTEQCIMVKRKEKKFGGKKGEEEEYMERMSENGCVYI